MHPSQVPDPTPTGRERSLVLDATTKERGFVGIYAIEQNNPFCLQ